MTGFRDQTMKLATHLVEKPWGRTDLPVHFAAGKGQRIGEVWFDQPDHHLPLLVKWLFTSDRLSIQVHPNDAQGRARGFVSGKEECWVVTAAEPGAVLGIGTTVPLDEDALRKAALSGEIEDLMDWKPVCAGDYFYIPAGTVHAVGAGVTLVEVQQHADVTFRLYDYGRPRELHLDDALAVARADAYSDLRTGRLTSAGCQQLVAGPYFNLWHLRNAEINRMAEDNSGIWIIPLAGSVSVEGCLSTTGECLYLHEPTSLSTSTDAAVLVASASL